MRARTAKTAPDNQGRFEQHTAKYYRPNSKPDSPPLKHCVERYSPTRPRRRAARGRKCDPDEEFEDLLAIDTGSLPLPITEICHEKPLKQSAISARDRKTVKWPKNVFTLSILVIVSLMAIVIARSY
jgi:hypothetical protein